MAGLGKVSIEEEDQIVRQLLFGELGEGSEIAEQDHDLALGAVEIAREVSTFCGVLSAFLISSAVCARAPKGNAALSTAA
jgi:hypothetical protein